MEWFGDLGDELAAFGFLGVELLFGSLCPGTLGGGELLLGVQAGLIVLVQGVTFAGGVGAYGLTAACQRTSFLRTAESGKGLQPASVSTKDGRCAALHRGFVARCVPSISMGDTAGRRWRAGWR